MDEGISSDLRFGDTASTSKYITQNITNNACPRLDSGLAASYQSRMFAQLLGNQLITSRENSMTTKLSTCFATTLPCLKVLANVGAHSSAHLSAGPGVGLRDKF
jgi:hypothetical protein